MEDLARRNCVPCEGTAPMTVKEAETFLRRIPEWTRSSGSIEREFRFKTYREGLEYAYAVGKLAELQGHHPDILIGWRKVRLTFSTHIIKGLSENDFVMAAKSEREYRKNSGRSH